MCLVWAIQATAVGGILETNVWTKGEGRPESEDPQCLIVIFFAVGWIEVISILFRQRLRSVSIFLNIYAGEKHSRSDCPRESVAVADLADSVSIPRSASGICAGASFSCDCGFHMLIAEHQDGTRSMCTDFSATSLTRPQTH